MFTLLIYHNPYPDIDLMERGRGQSYLFVIYILGNIIKNAVFQYMDKANSAMWHGAVGNFTG